MNEIKRSMSLHSAPVVVENGHARHPYATELAPQYDRASVLNWGGEWGFRVSRVTNSTEYRPGEAITKAQVDELITQGWTVSILR